MKRIVVMVCAVIGLALSSGHCHASWGNLFYSGYQPWWNVFAKRYKCLTPEEERLQKFWHDYYDAMQGFYCGLDKIDWVAYYKNHGYAINGGAGGGGCGRINYAPVFVSPGIQWAVPAGGAGGPPCGPPYGMGAGGPPMGNPYGMGGPPMGNPYPQGGFGYGSPMMPMSPSGQYGMQGGPMMGPSGPMGPGSGMPTGPRPTALGQPSGAGGQ